MPANAQPPARTPRTTLGRKLGTLFGVLALASLALVALVVVQLQRVREDASKFLEETREARLSHELMSTVEQMELVARLPMAQRPPDSRQILIIRARSLTKTLSTEHPRADPSREQHESVEQKILKELKATIAEYDEAGSGAETEGKSEPELAWRMEELATDLRDETSHEATLATQDLTRRVDRLVKVMIATAVVCLLVLVLFFLLVHRVVVRPVAILRRGTALFGQGRLDHRIEVRSHDEIGQLADEFNRMADSLHEIHRDLEERVRERTEQFIRAARLADLGTFAAGIAHEVNTPLASIASCAEGLERRVASGKAKPEEQVEYLQTIAREAYRARDITGRLLAFSREEQGPTTVVDPAEPLKDAARLLAHLLEKRGLRLHLDLAEPSPLVRANAAELEQVVVNLLKNACDASPDGGQIWLRSRVSGEAVLVEVEDEGPGVPEEHRGRIFDPFFTTKEPGQGTGLGLSLVFRIVESHGGRVEVSAAPAGGALFRVLLPVVAAGPGEAA